MARALEAETSYENRLLRQALTDAVPADVLEALPEQAMTEVSLPTVEATVRDEVEKLVAAFRERLESIETRFPDQSIVDKVSSVNEAIMATQIEILQRSLDKMEQRIEDALLTKWDVATIVFAILAALGVLVGAIFGLIRFIQG